MGGPPPRRERKGGSVAILKRFPCPDGPLLQPARARSASQSGRSWCFDARLQQDRKRGLSSRSEAISRVTGGEAEEAREADCVRMSSAVLSSAPREDLRADVDSRRLPGSRGAREGWCRDVRVERSSCEPCARRRGRRPPLQGSCRSDDRTEGGDRRPPAIPGRRAQGGAEGFTEAGRSSRGLPRSSGWFRRSKVIVFRRPRPAPPGQALGPRKLRPAAQRHQEAMGSRSSDASGVGSSVSQAEPEASAHVPSGRWATSRSAKPEGDRTGRRNAGTV